MAKYLLKETEGRLGRIAEMLTEGAKEAINSGQEFISIPLLKKLDFKWVKKIPSITNSNGGR
jgi:hypothetical protein